MVFESMWNQNNRCNVYITAGNTQQTIHLQEGFCGFIHLNHSNSWCWCNESYCWANKKLLIKAPQYRNSMSGCYLGLPEQIVLPTKKPLLAKWLNRLNLKPKFGGPCWTWTSDQAIMSINLLLIKTGFYLLIQWYSLPFIASNCSLIPVGSPFYRHSYLIFVISLTGKNDPRID